MPSDHYFKLHTSTDVQAFEPHSGATIIEFGDDLERASYALRKTEFAEKDP